MTWAKFDVSMETLPPPPEDTPVPQADDIIISGQVKLARGLPSEKNKKFE